MSTKSNIKEFIFKSKQIYGKNRYDYFKFVYKNNSTKSTIICHKLDENGKEHGEFLKNANKHLLGQGCPKCSKLCKLTKNIFVKRSNKIHNNKYDYSFD